MELQKLLRARFENDTNRCTHARTQAHPCEILTTKACAFSQKLWHNQPLRKAKERKRVEQECSDFGVLLSGKLWLDCGIQIKISCLFWRILGKLNNICDSRLRRQNMNLNGRYRNVHLKGFSSGKGRLLYPSRSKKTSRKHYFCSVKLNRKPWWQRFVDTVAWKFWWVYYNIFFRLLSASKRIKKIFLNFIHEGWFPLNLLT